MTYIIALALGIAVGIGLEFWFLSPKMLEKYNNANNTMASGWEAAKRARKSIDEAYDKQESTKTDENGDASAEQAQGTDSE